MLSVLLALVWLLLQQSLAVPQVITAVVLGLVVPWLVGGFLNEAHWPRNWGLVVRFTGIVLWDIVVSNLTVARLVLDPRAQPQPAWVPVPLDTRHPMVMWMLATVITTTPGTVSCVLDEAAGVILVHALDCEDAAAMAQQMKDRYETPLRQIFEGAGA
jgi:multicomponent K+:H+ antiporter subunit E